MRLATPSVVAALAGDWQAARDVHRELPESGVCSAALGILAIAEQFALDADAPAKLIAATSRHLAAHTSAAAAVMAAATELGIEPAAALHLAAFALERFDTAAPADQAPTHRPSPDRRTDRRRRSTAPVCTPQRSAGLGAGA